MDMRPEIDTDRLRSIKQVDRVNHEDGFKEPVAKFCDSGCRESYREDRIAGKPLPSINVDGQIVSHKIMCARQNICALCMSKLES